MAYSKVRSITAKDGFVIVKPSSGADVVVSVDEALDRAEAIGGLSSENHYTQNTTREMYRDLMEAVLLARRQQEELKKSGHYVEFALKQANWRRLEAYRLTRHIGGYQV